MQLCPFAKQLLDLQDKSKPVGCFGQFALAWTLGEHSFADTPESTLQCTLQVMAEVRSHYLSILLLFCGQEPVVDWDHEDLGEGQHGSHTETCCEVDLALFPTFVGQIKRCSRADECHGDLWNIFPIQPSCLLGATRTVTSSASTLKDLYITETFLKRCKLFYSSRHRPEIPQFSCNCSESVSGHAVVQ